jgi:MraZ protein
LDEKGRLALPTRYRAEVAERCNGSKLILTASLNRCLWLFPGPEFDEVEKKLNELPKLEEQNGWVQRIVQGHATEVDLDSQGRLPINETLRKYAELEKKVTLVGLGNKFEIWDEDTWDRNCELWVGRGPSEGGRTLSPELRALVL